MAEQKKKTADTGILGDAKKTLVKAADLASLQLEYHYLAARRKENYAHLGELTYILRRPHKTVDEEEINTEMDLTVRRITKISREMTQLAVQIKVLKMDMRQ